MFVAPQPPPKQESISYQNKPPHIKQVQPLPARPIQSIKEDKREPIKGVKKAMARTMSQANLIPHFSYCDEYNMNFLVELKSQLKSIGKERGIKISYLPIIIKVNTPPPI